MSLDGNGAPIMGLMTNPLCGSESELFALAASVRHASSKSFQKSQQVKKTFSHIGIPLPKVENNRL